MSAHQAESTERRRPFTFTGPGGTLPVRAEDQLALDLAMLVEGETSGRPLDEVLARFGRSRTAYYEKLRRYREEGVNGLAARPPGPHGPWRRSHDVVRFVVTARLRDPSRSPEAIARDLAQLGHEVSVRSVERTLQQFGLTRSRPRRQTAAAPAVTAPEAPQAPVHELDALASPPMEALAPPPQQQRAEAR
ncbi:MAG: helix-turn-helix domain-containing protein [Anaeromyxobacteraceae bacterium]